MNLLLLTNCVAAEQPFVQQLVTLGHEVFCSNQLLMNLTQKKKINEISNYFEGVIFSESVSNREVEEVWDVLSKVFSHFYRRSNDNRAFSPNSNSENAANDPSAIPIPVTASLETLREVILYSTDKSPLKNRTIAQEGIKEINFSHLEQKVVDILMENFGETVERETICELLWEERSEESMKSQLSSMTKKIKDKLEKSSIHSLRLQTIWGRGYCLKFL